jgi:hypothetical protein
MSHQMTKDETKEGPAKVALKNGIQIGGCLMNRGGWLNATLSAKELKVLVKEINRALSPLSRKAALCDRMAKEIKKYLSVDGSGKVYDAHECRASRDELAGILADYDKEKLNG